MAHVCCQNVIHAQRIRVPELLLVVHINLMYFMCNERNHSIGNTTTTYQVRTFKNKNERKSLGDIFVYHFFSFVSVNS